MISPVRFSAVYKTIHQDKQREKYDKECRRAASRPFTERLGPVIKDEITEGESAGTFLVCTQNDAVRISRASTAYELQRMKAERLPWQTAEAERAQEYLDSYHDIQQEMLEKAESLD